MLVDEILGPLGIPYAEVAFRKPPSSPYIVWQEMVTYDGDDNGAIYTTANQYTIDLYTPADVRAITDKIIRQLVEMGVTNFSKSYSEWDIDLMRFHTQITFTNTSKVRK